MFLMTHMRNNQVTVKQHLSYYKCCSLSKNGYLVRLQLLLIRVVDGEIRCVKLPMMAVADGLRNHELLVLYCGNYLFLKTWLKH